MTRAVWNRIDVFNLSRALFERFRQIRLTGCQELIDSEEDGSSVQHAILDPFVAATIHNHKFSGIYRLPQEILDMIISRFNPRVPSHLAAIFCLARVSRLLRHNIVHLYRLAGKPRGMPKYYSVDARNMVKYLLRKDLLCDACFSRSNIKINGAGQVVCHGRQIQNRCKFWGRQKDRIGREGILRLCDHRGLKWDDIEPRLVDIVTNETGKHGGFAASYRIRLMTCDHPEHKARPTMTLLVISNYCEGFQISIDWVVHTTLQPTKEGRLDLRHVRAMFQNNRQIGVHYLKSEISRGTTGSPYLPEMQCFGAKGCTCLAYETGTRNKAEPTEESKAPGFAKCLGNNKHKRDESASDEVVVDRCWRLFHRRCVTTHYSRLIMLGSSEPSKKSRIKPPHDWLHALDPDSYNLEDEATHGRDLGACKVPTCWNYYRTFQTGTCYRGKGYVSRVWEFAEDTWLMQSDVRRGAIMRHC
ncbi:hypothetical protein QBC44DRAFT_385341 [Cladorrhinum sp. PSN332]|nr:hypothetical protein QBC44DRAFT_385341 [Cladorrhinum sp. PSN332]